jgi:hypothetical protein
LFCRIGFSQGPMNYSAGKQLLLWQLMGGEDHGVQLLGI